MSFYFAFLLVSFADSDPPKNNPNLISTNSTYFLPPTCDVASWSMDEGTGTTVSDIEGNIVDKTITNATWTTRPDGGSALSFDGAGDYVEIGNETSLQLTGDMTIAMWIKADNFTNRQNPWGKAYGGEGTITLETNGALNFFWGTAGGNASPYSSFSSASTLTLNTWTHIAIVRDVTNGIVKWYINGTETSSVANTMAGSVSALPAYIGRGYVSDFAGDLDEVRVFDCALTATEVAGLMVKPGTNQELDDEVCYFISDGTSTGISDLDSFYTFNYVTGVVAAIGETGTTSIEAMAMDTVNNIIYGIDSDQLGTIDVLTGQFTSIAPDVASSLNGAEGVVYINDVDGMTYDHANNIIWATERRSSVGDGAPDDLLFQINPITGLAITDAFGAGIDYLVVDTPEDDLDDVAISENGTLYAISNYGASGNQALGIINKVTGAWTEIGDYGIQDVESLAFTATGQLVATTGYSGSNSNNLYTIDAGTGVATLVGSILPGYDVEGCDCMSGKLLNLQIGDKVFADLNGDGIQDLEEPGVANVTVNLLNSDGSAFLNSSNAPTTTVTDAVGIYNFDNLGSGDYIIEFVLPSGASFATANQGGDDNLDSDANTSNGRSHVITLAGSTNDMTVDAGMINTGAALRDCNDVGQLFVADESGNIMRFDQITGAFIDNFITGLTGPLEMIAGSDDWLYISNSTLDEIRRYSLVTGVLIDVFDASMISDPNGVTIGPDGNLYFNNDDTDEVLKLDVSNGNTSVFVTAGLGGVDGNKNGIEFGPDGNLYVTSIYTDQVLRYNGTTGAFIDVFVTANSTYANDPVDLTFGPDGNLYVAARSNDKVARYNGTTGAYIDEFVTYQSGGMDYPTNLEFGDDGNLYVSSQSGTTGILKYNGTTGAFIENFAAAPTPNGIYFAPVPGECPEICNNGIDDDGDGLIDSADPDCTDFCATECPSPYLFNWYDGSEGAQWPITNGESTVERLYEINGDRGLYVVTVTMNNPDGQNIDLSNCGTAGNHFYTATCNDPNASYDCDGDPVSTDGQFNYDCGYLTFGITSNNSDEFVSITYDFPYPTQLCDFEIGDIDYQLGSGVSSWQDEIDIVADSSGVGVNIHALVGSSVTVTNNATPSINLLANLNAGSGNISPNDVAGHAYITTLSKITSITFSYSNGPDDEGQSDDHAIRISGFDFCPDPREICDNGIDDDGDNLIDCLDPDCAQPTIANLLVSDCIDQPLRDVVEVSVEVSWNSVPEGGNINVIIDDQVKVIGTTLSGVTSPQTVTFIVTADDLNRTVTTEWDLASYCSDSMVFDTPAACSSDEINCSILYLCGLDKPYDGDAWDHGWIEYLDEVNGGNAITPILTKNESGMGTYDVMNQNTFVNVNLADYDLIIVSATTENHIATDLINSLKDAPNSILLGNLNLQDDFGMSSTPGDVKYGTWAYTNNTTSEEIFNYNNPNGWGGNLFTTGDYTSTGTASLWANAGDTNNAINGIIYKFDQSDALPGIAATHGTRVYNGIHFNGLYANPTNGGALPSPVSSWFTPEKHLTLIGKELFDQALVDASAGCQSSCDLNVTIDFSGDICLEDDSQLTATVTGATGTPTYSWTGPNSFTSSLQTIDADANGNYYLTVTEGTCTTTASAYIYEEYNPTVTTLSTEVCEGDDVTLTVNSATATNFLWGSNAGNAETGSITVTPSPPSTTYTVTVTNNLGCQATASVTIDVIEYVTVNVTGPSTICVGETSNISPTTGGTWESTNTSVATVAANGIVYGIAPGTATFVFTNSSTNCESLPTAPITVTALPTVSITGANEICEGFTTTLSPTTGGTWSSSDDNIATVTNAGVVTGVSEGSATFTFTQTNTTCTSNPTLPITVNDIPEVNITGPTLLCIGSTSSLTPMSGGSWVSSNTNVATVTNGGIVTAVGSGTANFTFTTVDGCVSLPTPNITVDSETTITISGDPTICENETTTLTASNNGGTWSSSNTGIATINSATGLVTAVAAGSVTITYQHNGGSCSTSPTFGMVIDAIPTINISGVTELCVGNVTTLTTNGSGGSWSSSDAGVAVVSSDGIVAGVGAGTATFTYTGANGCESDASGTITINPSMSVAVDFNGSQCLVEDSQLSAIVTGGSGTHTYAWTGPGGFSANTQTIDITIDGNYSIVVSDDAGCTANTTAFVYESYEPFIFALNTTVCEGETVTLSVNGSNVQSYQWGANAGNATSQSVTVTPGVPSTSYNVTVTNTIGCTTVATAEIDVDPKPVVSITGSDEICINQTTQLSPATGGTWTTSNGLVAQVTNSGLVTGLSAGSSVFTFKADNTNCISDPTLPVTVGTNGNITINGLQDVCMGSPTLMTSSEPTGVWSSSNTSIATINSSGVVTPISAGLTTITFVPSSSDCYGDANYDIEIHSLPTLSLNGPSTICEDENTYVSSSHSGSWTSSDNSIATINSSGVVTGISAGTVNISFTSDVGCTKDLSTPLTVVGKAIASLTGPPAICINETSSLSPTTGGIWISSASSIATVSSNGIVTGISPGTAVFTFIESTNGCVSDDMINIVVNGKPNINGLTNNDICIGETSNITPSTGGTWESTDDAIATIQNDGTITGISAGTVNFRFTDNITGCVSDLSASLTVRPTPDVNFTGPTDICIGENSSISSSGAGQWSSTDVSIATIDPSGVITGVGPGDVTFIFTSNATGCSSDESDILTVGDPTEVTITGPSEICIGESTNLTPNTGGAWSSSNVNIATITNAGLVVGVSAGTVTFTFDSDSGCISDGSAPITVKPLPIVSYVGPSSICIGTTTALSPSSGGTWSSSDESVATVDANGIVTALAYGTTDLTFEDADGCSSTLESSLNVFNVPVVVITGQDEICIGEFTYLSPSTGGTWTSSDPSIATVSNNGEVFGVSPGTVTFVYSETGSNCVSNASDPIDILGKPNVSITGPNNICVGATTTLSPSTGGSWISDNPTVASVTDAGIVTGLSQGIAKFTFISNSGCASNKTSPIIVYGAPSILISGPSDICIDENLQMLPSTGGTWTSSDDAIASINNSGLVTAISEGTVTFTFLDSNTGCYSDESDNVTVHPVPEITINGPSEICIGGTTYMTPFSGGYWTALNPTIASIQNDGLVTGISPGQARFLFTNITTGCVSDTSSYVTVNNGPTISLNGPDELCIGETSQMLPNSGGTWTSTNPLIATIDDTGLVTAIASGIVKFRYTETSTGCMSQLSESIVVNGIPTVNLIGSSPICIGSSTLLSPSTGGTWESLDPTIASVNNSGEVTGLLAGTAFFQFTDGDTGCKSDGLLSVVVSEILDVQITGESEICTGYTTTLSPTTGGIWSSSNPKVAQVSNFGIVTGLAPGVATFTFVDANTGCSVGGTTEPITVGNCLNHDFNVAVVDQLIQGNVNTNDNISQDATYSNIKVTVSKPLASNPILNINPDGSYSFTTNKPGKYLYKVSVCLPPVVTGCPSAFLEINVVEAVYANPNVVANLEHATTYANINNSLPGQTININALSNDQCVLTSGCNIDNTTLTITDAPGNGSATVITGGIIEYTPVAGFVGTDTLEYEVCDGLNQNCSTSIQLITVSDPSASNTVIAADDFGYTMKEITLNGNVIMNDMDPEGDNITVTQQGSILSPIQIPEGEYYINSDGTYGFTSTSTFHGHLEIVYTICDDAVPSVCTNATLHLQVFDDVSLRIRVYLEGALIENTGENSLEGNPLMRDDLRVNPYDGNNYIPTIDPYSVSNWQFDNSPEMFEKVGPGMMPENIEITDPTTVFSVTGQDAIVDWIYVQIRDKDSDTTVVATRSGLLQRDGDIVDLDGTSLLRFQGINLDSFYVVVKHRSHLGVMSSKIGVGTFVDFTDPNTALYNYGTSLNNGADYTGLSQKSTVEDGYLALWAGDTNSDGKIKFTEPASDQNILYGDVLFSSPSFLINYDHAYGYFKGDYNMDGKAKYTNPDDDKNYMLAQILFYSQNSNYIANYGNLIEQVAK